MVQSKSQLQIKTTGIDHVVLWVENLPKARQFYMGVLGMTVAHESEWQCFLWCGENQVALFDASRQGITVGQANELNHMALRMEPASYEAVKARLEEEGVEVTGRRGDDRCVYFDDPEGHRLQLLFEGHD